MHNEPQIESADTGEKSQIVEGTHGLRLGRHAWHLGSGTFGAVSMVGFSNQEELSRLVMGNLPSTVGTVATFAGGIGLSIISVGVALLLFRALCELPSLFRRSSQEEPIVVQASKDNFPAAASLTGGGSSAARSSEHSVTHQETTSRGSQVASSVRAKEGVANQKDRSDHVSCPPRALGG